MNKKFLFAAMSLVALTACTNDEFQSKQIAAEETSPIKFEVINDAMTRASMDGNTVVWNANDGDLFTLYHGAAAPADGANLVTPYQNATYKANATDGSTATLTTPSMILQGSAIMVWPVDTNFRATIPAGKLTVKIPVNQPADVENQIPYVSDLIAIGAYTGKNYDDNTAGLGRNYPVFMRPMASQLNLKTDYAGTDKKIAELYKGGSDGLTDDAVEPIKVESMELLTQEGGGGADNFTSEIPLKFKTKSAADNTRWNTKVSNNAWSHVTQFDVDNIAAGGKTDKLTTISLTEGNKGGKFLILPQAAIADGVDDAGIVVNTIYGKVVIAAPGIHGSEYSADEFNNAWYRYLPENQKLDAATTEENASAATPDADGDNVGLYKTVAKSAAYGMQQTINYMSNYVRNSASSVVNTEPIGVALNRYVVVNLGHLDMSDLHIKNDKQLRDVVRVWKKLGLPAVTVKLDGDANNQFKISQKTIKKINELNAGGLGFRVMPCVSPGHKTVNEIVITGSNEEQNIQNIAFIKKNGTKVVTVVLANEGDSKPWIWSGNVQVGAADVAGIINKGYMQNSADATLKTVEFGGAQNNVNLKNEKIWNITAGKVNVQFTVWNTGTVNISKGAEYREANAGHAFYNYAEAVPSRFIYAASHDDSKIGVVNNYGVFATLNNGEIMNIGLIEHADNDAKTYITYNQYGPGDAPKYGNVTFANAFNYSETAALANMIGRINLQWSNKEEDNVSVSAALEQGFVSVTVNETNAPNDGVLNTSVVGPRVNYVIIKGGIKQVSNLPTPQIKYVEFDEPGTEIAWSVANAVYEGMMVLSDVNIKLGSTVTVTKATYLGADMYVGGTFNTASWSGYYGDTDDNYATKFITY
jgi:hypothetical protein